MANPPVPVPRTFSVDEVEVAAYLNAVRDALTFLLNPPMAVLYQGVAQAAIATATYAAITFDTTTVDTYGGHSAVTNPSRYTAQQPGWYEVCGTVSWPSNGTGARGARIAKNGSVLVTGAAAFIAAVVTDRCAVTTPAYEIQLNTGDYVEVDGFQSSGGALAPDVSVGDLRSSMNIRWVHA